MMKRLFIRTASFCWAWKKWPQSPPLFAVSTEWGGATVKEKREVWAGSGMKTKEHMQRQDFRLVAWAALTHVALVLRYNLAFWLLWNGPLLPAELDFSVISAQRLEVCSHKSTCWRHCTYGPLRNKKFPHTGWFVLFILWAGPSADKLTDCAPGLYS